MALLQPLPFRIECTTNPPDAAVQRIRDELNRFTESRIGDKGNVFLAFNLFSDQGEFIGGLTARLAYGWLFVDLLWVAEKARSQGQGRALMAAAEQEARTRGCRHAWLDTFSFQARYFYEKLGYTVFGELADFPPGHSRYFMRKDL